jgi:hypothetical protein
VADDGLGDGREVGGVAGVEVATGRVVVEAGGDG